MRREVRWRRLEEEVRWKEKQKSLGSSGDKRRSLQATERRWRASKKIRRKNRGRKELKNREEQEANFSKKKREWNKGAPFGELQAKAEEEFSNRGGFFRYIQGVSIGKQKEGRFSERVKRNIEEELQSLKQKKKKEIWERRPSHHQERKKRESEWRDPFGDPGALKEREGRNRMKQRKREKKRERKKTLPSPLFLFLPRYPSSCTITCCHFTAESSCSRPNSTASILIRSVCPVHQRTAQISETEIKIEERV